MTAHLIFPYNWVDCASPETCQESVHLEDTAKSISDYPREWLESLLNCTIRTSLVNESIEFYDTKGMFHRENGPAVIKHSDFGPAMPDYSSKRWYQHGQLHRDDGPAKEWVNGDQEWYKRGKKHRVDGPAIILMNGTQEWWLNGKLHREDGPAVISFEGKQEWWIHGVEKPNPEEQEEETL